MKSSSTVKKQVEKILTSYKKSRSNDGVLYGRLLSRYYNVDIVDDVLQVDLEKLSNREYPAFETVSRYRRHFQSQGWFCIHTTAKDFMSKKQIENQDRPHHFGRLKAKTEERKS